MRFAFLLIALAACGGSRDPVEHPVHGESMPPALEGFHDVLAPVWHSDAATRAQKACDSSTAMVDKVAATNDAELISAVSALAKTCMSADKSQVEPQLTKVHERFHALMEQQH